MDSISFNQDRGKNDPNLDLPFNDPSQNKSRKKVPIEIGAGPKKETTKKEIGNKFGSLDEPKGIFVEEEKKPSKVLKVLKYLGIVFAVAILLYIVLNWHSLYQIAKYMIVGSEKETLAESVLDENLEVIDDIPVPSEDYGEEKQESRKETAIIKAIKNNHIIIPKIGVYAPILWQTPEQNMIERLRSGVAHYKGTALPGDSGNVFITGHSSYYSFDPGNFKRVFALLSRLGNNDPIFVTYKNTKFQYRVSRIFTVKPDETDILYPTRDNVLRLMTCVPVGTVTRRLIVEAKETEITENKMEELPEIQPGEGDFNMLPPPGDLKKKK